MHKSGRVERRVLLGPALLAVGALALGAGAALGAPPPPTMGQDGAPVVLAAASLKDVLAALADAYFRTGRPRPSLSFAASSALARQIEAGAPADLFVSADEEWMNEVEGRGLLRRGSRSDLLGNRLVLIAPQDGSGPIKIEKGFPLAAALGAGRLAVAGDAVPAGLYAKAALQSLGVFQSVEGRLARADNVRGALFFVGAGEAPLGIVYETDALIEPRVKIVGVFPEWSHPPIVYPVALLAGAGREAEALLAFLKGPEARKTFARAGFRPLF